MKNDTYPCEPATATGEITGGTPTWAAFFESQLYERYKHCIQSYQFSKILLDTQPLDRVPRADTVDSVESPHEREMETSDTLQYSPEKCRFPEVCMSHVSAQFSNVSGSISPVEIDQYGRRRQRRTMAWVVLGLLAIVVAALTTAFILHYIYIPKDAGTTEHNIVLANFSEKSTTGLLEAEQAPSSNVKSVVQRSIAEPLSPERLLRLMHQVLVTCLNTTFTFLHHHLSLNRWGSAQLLDTTEQLLEDLPQSRHHGQNEEAFFGNKIKQPNLRIPESKFKNTLVSRTLPLENMEKSSVRDRNATSLIHAITDAGGSGAKSDANKTPPNSPVSGHTYSVSNIFTGVQRNGSKSDVNKTPSESSVLWQTPHVVSDALKREHTTAESSRDRYLPVIENNTPAPDRGEIVAISTPPAISTLRETTSPISKTNTTSTTIAIITTLSMSPNSVTSAIRFTTTKPTTMTLTKTSPTTSTISSTTVTTTLTTSSAMTTPTPSPPTASTTTSTTTPTTTSPPTSTTTTTPSTTTSTTSSTTTPTTTSSTTLSTPTTTSSTTSTTPTTPSTTTTSISSSTTTPTTTSSKTLTTQTTTSSTTLTTPTTSSTTTSTTTPTTTTTTVKPTTLPPFYNIVSMSSRHEYANDGPANMTCNVTFAVKWNSITIQRTDKSLSLTLTSQGRTFWRGKGRRNLAMFEIRVDEEETHVTNVTLVLFFKWLYCRDRGQFVCMLDSAVGAAKDFADITTVGKPASKIQLAIGPSTIEGQAVRLTATWVAGYPQPWANFSWTAREKGSSETYNLEEYGRFKEFALEKDHGACQTRLKSSLVIFPRMNLNATTVTIVPRLDRTRHFVSDNMKHILADTEPGVLKLLVIPLRYCATNRGKNLLPHPYEPCHKYVRCLAFGRLAVQPCPVGTCFKKDTEECA